MGFGRIKLDYGVLRQILPMPDDYRISTIVVDRYDRGVGAECVWLYVQSPSLPEPTEGEEPDLVPPYAVQLYTRIDRQQRRWQHTKTIPFTLLQEHPDAVKDDVLEKEMAGEAYVEMKSVKFGEATSGMTDAEVALADALELLQRVCQGYNWTPAEVDALVERGEGLVVL